MDTVRAVTVVGAGIAGLAAASCLVRAGVNVVVLEAQNAPGGRILSVRTENGTLELGAQWLHGENSHLCKMAAERDLVSDEISEEGQGRYCRADGSVVPSSVVNEVNAAILHRLRNCEEFVNKSKYPTSVGHELCEEFQQLCKRSQRSTFNEHLLDELFSWHERFHLIDNSCNDLRELSAKSWGLYKDCGENHCINFKNGFSSLIDTLVKDLPEGSLVLNTPVRHIEWTESVEARSRTPRVKIVCDQLEILSNHVIVTCSLGFLKENQHRMFIPKLPPPLSTAINLLGFGSITKLFLVYESAWWSEEDKGFQLVWRDDKTIAESVPWADGVTGFDVVANKPVLLGWVGGRSAPIVEGIPEVEIKQQATELLRKFTGNPNIPEPSSILRSNWHQNEYVRGAYSFIPSACDSENITSETLAQPVYTKIRKGSINQAPTIVLAGEACHKKYYSTVHGAYDSGMKQASLIIDYIKRTESCQLSS